MTAAIADLVQVLKESFGYGQFRPGQREIIQAVLSGRDVLGVMPTGGGKSLCFQLPALVKSGLTLVVSPLIALMQDQVDALRNNGIAATFLNSSLSRGESRDRISAVLEGSIKLLYVAPERLLSEGFMESVLDPIQAEAGLALLAIDEAHCVSEWGHDFRPEYRQLRQVRQRYAQVPVMALTATATDRVRQDITQQLQLRSPYTHIASFNRPNLYYEVREKPSNGNQAFSQLLRQLRQLEGSGIIYCLSRKQVDELTLRLNHSGIQALPYHAGLGGQERTQNQLRFIQDDVSIMVATIAFGMGINKPDVRFVIHYDLPRNIEGYYQESGRAGRDGEPARCTLYFNPGDIKKIEWIIDQKVYPETGAPLEEEQRVARQQLQQVVAYAESPVCRRTIQLGYFGESFAGNCQGCDNCCYPMPMEDWTIEAQKFLSCVARCRERFGMTHIIDVLRGSRKDKVLKHNHQELSTYGIGQDRSVNAWKRLGRTLLQQGLLEETSDGYGILKLNAESWAVMRQQRQVWVAISKEQASQEAEQAAPQDDRLDEAGAGLFQALRRLRKQLADEQSVPPYVIFSDTSLREMARYRPASLGAFSTISGVGRRKLEQFGQVFTETIQAYCKDHGLTEVSQVKSAARRREVAEANPDAPSATELATLALFRDGLTIAEIAKQRGIRHNRVYDHLARLIAKGEKIDIDGLVPPDRQSVIWEALAIVGGDRLKPIFEHLNEQYSYEEIRLVHAQWQRQHLLQED